MTQYIVPGLIIAVAFLFGGLGMLSQTTDVLVYFKELPKEEGGPLTVAVSVDATLPINVVSGTISYPKDAFTVEIKKSESSAITVWIEEPKLSNEGEIAFAGGTNDRAGLLNGAELFTLTLSSTTPEEARMYFSKVEAFASNGQGTKLNTTGGEYIVNKKIEPTLQGGSGSHVSTSGGEMVIQRSDFDKDGEVTLGDLSIFMVKMLTPYEEHFDINDDKKISVEDLSILLSVLGKHEMSATSPAQ